MIIRRVSSLFLLSTTLIFIFSSNTFGQRIDEEKTDNEKISITVFLKHNKEKSLDEIQKHLDKTGFWKEFPPQSAEVISWYIMMGVGHVVTLKIPTGKLRN